MAHLQRAPGDAAHRVAVGREARQHAGAALGGLVVEDRRAAVAGLEGYLADVADSESLAATDRVRLRTLGPTQGAVVNGGMPGAVALVTFLVAAGLTWFGLTLLTRRRLGQPLIREPRTPGRVSQNKIAPAITTPIAPSTTPPMAIRARSLTLFTASATTASLHAHRRC